MYLEFKAKLLSQPEEKVALKVGRNYDVSTEDFKSYKVTLTTGFYELSAEQFFNHFSVEHGIEIPTELLSPDCKDKIYRDAWAEHVTEDVKSYLNDNDRFESMDEASVTDLCKTVAERYAFCGDYDCNLDYWTNLNNLIEEEMRRSYAE